MLLFSGRGMETRKWHGFQYEFEDVVAEVDSVEVVAPPRRPATSKTRLSNFLNRRLGHPERVAEPAIEPTEIAGRYDLFFAVFAFAYDAPNILRLKGWRERCDKAVCFIVELFSDSLEVNRPYL